MATIQPTIETAAGEKDSASKRWMYFWALLFLASVPLLIPYMIDMWAHDRYRYFPFALLATGWLVYNRFDGRFYPPRSWFSWGVISIACVLIAGSAVIQFPWFAAVGFVLIALCCLHAMRGHEDTSLLVCGLPLLTFIQLPRADVLLTQKLQDITTWLSSVMLDASAVPHTVSNRVIQLADRELFVAEACSGIQSVFTLGFLACVLLAFRRRPVWLFPVYLLIACLLAVLANVIRVTVVALGIAWFQIDMTAGWSHDMIGYLALIIAGLFLLSFDHLLVTLLHIVQPESEFNPLISAWNFFAVRTDVEVVADPQINRDAIQDATRRDQASAAFLWANRLSGSPVAKIGFACLIGLIAIGSAVQVLRSSKPKDILFSNESLVFDPDPKMLDPSLHALRVVSHTPNRGYEDPRLGANSDVWECETGDVKAQFVLSQPHKGWHELCDCYERLDWMLINRNIKSAGEMESLGVSSKSPQAIEVPYVVARFKKDPGQFGYLLFAGIGSDGALIPAPSSLSAFTHRIWNRIDGSGVWNQDEVIMLQMWVTSPRKLTAKNLQELEDDFVAARATFAEAIAANASHYSGDEGQVAARTLNHLGETL
ncbi:exosortase U [Stieleria varia]|uniref:Transmembrane exosortase n=1 Tax=Stieleria varia TaxID=2528005 RepID=A0A5C6AYU5_9BACT|nr:exosortase U [Stieleria varia]TWU04860.1 Transmembrane exosortase [Stieleria varia]